MLVNSNVLAKISLAIYVSTVAMWSLYVLHWFDICTPMLFLQAAGWRTWWAQCECPKDWRCRVNHTWRAVWTGTWYRQSAKLVELCRNCNRVAHDCFTGKDLKRPKLGDGDYFQPTWFRAGLFFGHLEWVLLYVFQFAYPHVFRHLIGCPHCVVQKRVAMVMKKAGIKGQIMLIAFLVVLFIILFVLVFLT